MESLYTDDIRKYIRSRDWPKGLIYEVVEYEEHLAMRFFRDNFNSFDGEDRLHIAMMVKEVMEKIRSLGVPIYMEKMETAYYGGNE